MSNQALQAAVQENASSLENAVYAKASRRLIPFLFLCYVFAYLDRVNVGFAKLQMLADLKFSESIYGLGAGIFFLGYCTFEVPSNIALHRFGARRWIARIMLTWGVISACMIFVKTPASFYVLRFALGVAEAGFFPGIIFYLTDWFPASRRGRITAFFLTGIPMAGIIGGPLSGWILTRFDQVHHLPGWQWLFLLEAIPSLVFGVATLFYLDDKISSAKWLTPQEKKILEENVANDKLGTQVHGMFDAFFHPRVWILCFIYFGKLMGVYGLSFWLPSLIRASGVEDAYKVGLLIMIPYGATVIAMILLGHSSDKRRERRWHVAVPMLVSALGLFLAIAWAHQPVLLIVAVTLATMGSTAPIGPFWSLPSAFLGGAAAATGIALINSVGCMAGFFSPYLIGRLKDATHSTSAGLLCIAAFMIAGACMCFTIPKAAVNR